jgi:hypothetical protein
VVRSTTVRFLLVLIRLGVEEVLGAALGAEVPAVCELCTLKAGNLTADGTLDQIPGGLLPAARIAVTNGARRHLASIARVLPQRKPTDSRRAHPLHKRISVCREELDQEVQEARIRKLDVPA